MPPVVRFTRESVLNAAYSLVRREGPSTLNARAVARELGGSTQPIFRLFTGMEELRNEVIRLADVSCRRTMHDVYTQSQNGYLPVCMAYMIFAREEPQLFKLLFMQDRNEHASHMIYDHSWGVEVITASASVDSATASRIYDLTWFHVHGMAVCIATKYTTNTDDASLYQMLTNQYNAAMACLGLPSAT